MKKKILILVISLIAVLSMLSLTALASGSENNGKEITIEAVNLSFEDSVYVLYAVSHEDIDVSDIQMLFWTEPQENCEDYKIGTQSYVGKYLDDGVSVNGKSCAVFKNDNLRAKNMSDYVYARAYAVVGGVEYYSEVSKYSILQYAYNKLGKTGTPSDNAALKNMLESMLEYGGDAQIYANYNTERLANDEYYQISVSGGVLEDGFAKGLYNSGEIATLTAPAISGDLIFSGWRSSAGNIVSTENRFNATAFSANESYTAVYEQPIKYSEGLKYTISNDGTYYSVTGIGSCTDKEIFIPPTYKGLPVKAIGNSAFSHCDAVSVTIPDSITSIGNSAFSYCSSLTSVTIGDSVTAIGKYAFDYCHKLVEVINHSSLNIVAGSSDYGYIGCYAIEIHTGESKIVNVDDYFFYTYDGINYLVGYVGDDRDLVLPDSYNGESYEIYEHAFHYRNDITSVTIPDSVTSIGGYAFDSCSSLTSIEIGDSVTSIGKWAFSYCSSLTGITIGDSVTSIGECAFSDCTSLTSIEIGNSVTSIGRYAFWCCSSLASVTIGDSVTSIGERAFSDCTSLTSVDIGDSVTSIGDSAFSYCTSLTSVTIGDSVVNIGGGAFEGCCSIMTITIPSSVADIGYGAFDNCYRLVEVINYSDVEISWNSNSNYMLADSSIIEVHKGDSKIVNVEDYLFYSYEDTNYLIGYVGCDANITLPKYYNGDRYIINEFAFYDNDNIVTVTIPSGIYQIGVAAFSGCNNLTDVVICNDRTHIEAYAFSSCESLININIPAEIWYLSPFIFAGCSSLTEIIIPDGIEYIYESALSGCSSLVSVIIPDSVIRIDMYAFNGCSSLTSVVFETTEGWCCDGYVDNVGMLEYDIKDPEVAAMYLKETYCYCYWFRE